MTPHARVSANRSRERRPEGSFHRRNLAARSPLVNLIQMNASRHSDAHRSKGATTTASVPSSSCCLRRGERPALCFILIDRGPLTPEEPEHLPIAAQKHVPFLIVGETARRE